MAKIFVSYKYADSDVEMLDGKTDTQARHYVDDLQARLEGEHINKGENDGESMDTFKDETIESKLRDKIYDSTVTIVLISPNMKEVGKSEDDQWIPWEISYSLKEITRDGRTSGTNAMLAVVLPDRTGSYAHFVESVCGHGCVRWNHERYFEIIGKNMFNRKAPKLMVCPSHTNSGTHTGNDHSYIYPVTWNTFIQDINGHIGKAQALKDSIEDFNLQKVVTLDAVPA